MLAKDQFRSSNGTLRPDQTRVMSRLEWFEALKSLYFGLDREKDDSVDKQKLLLELLHSANSLNLRSETDYFASEHAESAFSLGEIVSILQETSSRALSWDQLFDLVIQLPPHQAAITAKPLILKRTSAGSDCFLQNSLATNTVQTTFSQLERGNGGETERSSRENMLDKSFGRSKLVGYPRELGEMTGNLQVRRT